MLTRVEVSTRRGTLLNLPLADVDSGYVVEEVEGLDPVKATLVSSSFAGQDGEQFHSSKRDKRQLKLKIKFEPDFVDSTVKSLRQNLYSFLMPESEVKLRFHDTDGSYVDIMGRVESNDTPLFSMEPGADVSLLCFNPDFIDPNPITVSGASTSIVTANTEIIYRGTVKSGILFEMTVDRPVSAFSIMHTAPDNTVYLLDFQADLIAGDKVTIATTRGSKGATLTRSNVVSSLLYAVSPAAKWIELEQGTNKIRVALSGTPIPWQIRYLTRHGGL